MTPFAWNINLFIFWRLAWMYKTNVPHEIQNWHHIGHIYYCKQTKPWQYIIEPKLKKIKNLLANLLK